MKKPKVIIAAGGTGGHLFPALSFANAIKEKHPDAEFLFIGTGRPLEEKIIDPSGWKRVVLRSSGLKGQGVVKKIRAVGQAFRGVFEARRIISDFGANLCFGAGGYVTGPVGLAAKLSNVPLVIHEQNSKAGLSNILLGKCAKLIMLGFENARKDFDHHKTVVTGNPVRREIEALHKEDRNYDNDKKFTVLILGGSQGASRLNKFAVWALVRLAREGYDFKIIHQTGADEVEAVTKQYEEAGLDSHVAPFFDNMADIYRVADIGVCRAGALTLAEVAAAKLPAIFVPLPTAADDHQTVNADSMAAPGAARMVSEASLENGALHHALKELLSDRSKLAQMSELAGEQAVLNAAATMAELSLPFIKRN